jgi:CHASE3 domain sensor protein
MPEEPITAIQKCRTDTQLMNEVAQTLEQISLSGNEHLFCRVKTKSNAARSLLTFTEGPLIFLIPW